MPVPAAPFGLEVKLVAGAALIKFIVLKTGETSAFDPPLLTAAPKDNPVAGVTPAKLEYV